MKTDDLEISIKLAADADHPDLASLTAQLRVLSSAPVLLVACEEALPELQAFLDGKTLFASEVRPVVDYLKYAILKAKGQDTIHEMLERERAERRRYAEDKDIDS